MPPLKYDRSLLLFGPYDGEIVHDPDNRTLEFYRALEAPGDILIEATFLNPYPDPGLKWEHGFLFKYGGSSRFYSTTLESTEDWEHYARLGDRGVIGFWDGPLPEINTESGAENLLQVALVRGIAWTYVNGTFAGSFSVDLDTGGDGVWLIADDDFEGATIFKDAAVWKWDSSMYRDFSEIDPGYVPPATPTPTITPTPNPLIPVFGPVGGRILHDSDDGLFAQYQGPEVVGDVMVEVTFEVPFAPNESHWNFGIQFDVDRPSTYHWIEISGEFGGRLNHWRLSGPDSRLQGRLSEDLVGLNLQKGDTNHVRIIVVGDSGWVYVNDRRVTIVNFSLGDIPNPEEIDLLILDTTSRGPGYGEAGHTKFEDFTVWRWHPSLFDLPDDD
ncbi:MAG: hypothetical protein OXI91_14770 [Chloroflexota bacterium]|nr:hypothetical protein [Chloroflexota bacterium]